MNETITPTIRTNVFYFYKLCLIIFTLLASSDVWSQQGSLVCNTYTPWISPAFSVTESHSSTPMLACWEGDIECPGGDVPANVVNSSTSDFATGIIMGAGTLTLRVTDNTNDYSAGNFIGYRVASNLLELNVYGSITISTYLNNVFQESVSAGNLLAIGVNLSNDQFDLGFITTMSYDAVEITISDFLGMGSYDVYYSIVEDFCPGPGLECNVQTPMNTPVYPVAIDYMNTGSSGITAGQVDDPENAISADPTDYASLVNIASAPGSTFIAVEEQITNYPAGTFVGFDIQNLVVVDAGILSYVTITTYLDDVQQESETGPDLLISADALGNSGRHIVGFVTTTPVDKVKITITQPASVSLETTRVYGAIFQMFCEGDINCNELTVLHTPEFPVFIDVAHTGFTGAACALCTVEDANNVIDANLSNWAEIDVVADVAAIGSLAVKDALTNYDTGIFAGFHIQNPLLVGANMLSGITISTYLDGTLQESETNLGALITIGSGLLVGTGEHYVGFMTTESFDEIKISLSNIGGFNIGTTRIYSSIIEEFCPAIIECDTTYYLNNPEFPVYIDAFRTGIDGAACAACAVVNEQNVITADASDYATITITAGAVEAGSIAVADAIYTYPAGTFAGFVIDDQGSLLEAILFESITISTYNNGVFQESRSGFDLIDLAVFILFISAEEGRYNIGFEATLPFDEIRITVGSLAMVSNVIRVYSAFVDTRSSDGGSLDCVNGPLAVDDEAVTDEETPVTIDVLANDIDDESPLGFPMEVDSPNHGSVVPNSVDSTFTYTPDDNFVGLDSFTYSICNDDSPPLCDEALVVITVNPVIDTIEETIQEDETLVVCANDLTTFNSPATSIAVCDPPANGTAQASADCVTYTPDPDFTGNDTMCVVACHPDIPAMCDTTIVIITVTPVNDPPVAVDDEANTSEDDPVSIDVLANDSDPDSPLGLPTVLEQPSNGNATLSPGDSTIIYQPDSGFVGIDTFTYSICDDGEPSLCDSAMVIVNVYPDPDTIGDINIPLDSILTICASLIVDLPGPAEVILVCDPPEKGTLIVIDTCIQYIPDSDASGEDTICVSICDGDEFCDTAVIIITIELPLPVTWLSFEAMKSYGRANLRWITGTEFNNSGFQVERSINGHQYEAIGYVEAQSLIQETYTYTFTDHYPNRGSNYYRIKQIDRDGHFSYSNVVSLAFTDSGTMFKMWPNPVVEYLHIELNDDLRSGGIIKLFNSTGVLIRSHVYEHLTGEFNMNMSDVQPGIYNVIIEASNTRLIERIIVMH